MGKGFIMTKLILIRHGETNYNLEKKYCGHSDILMNRKGVSQIKKLSKKVKSFHIDKIYSSDLKRAVQTSKILFNNRPVTRLEELREMNFGVFEGLDFEAIHEKFEDYHNLWLHDPMKVTIPGGESFKDFKKRVIAKIRVLLRKHKDETVAIVAHGGTIRLIICYLFKKSFKFFWQVEQRPGALNIIHIKNGRVKAVTLNDTSHEK